LKFTKINIFFKILTWLFSPFNKGNSKSPKNTPQEIIHV
jgi:hypothetical protein